MGNVYALIPTRKSWILILEHWFPPCPIPQAESNLPSYFDVYFTLWSTNIFKIFIFNSCHVSLLEGKLLRICSIYRLGLGYNPLITSLEPCRCQTKAGSKLGWYIYIYNNINNYVVRCWNWCTHKTNTHTHIYINDVFQHIMNTQNCMVSFWTFLQSWPPPNCCASGHSFARKRCCLGVPRCFPNVRYMLVYTNYINIYIYISTI